MKRCAVAWDGNAPSIHDCTVLAVRSRADVVEVDVRLDEEQGWATLHLSFVLAGEKAPCWRLLEEILAGGAEPELMFLRFNRRSVHLGLSVEPAVDGMRWADIHEQVNQVLYALSPR